MGFFSSITGGSLLSLGGNIFSSLAGRSRGQKRVPLSKLVAEAKAAGLHPLAALGVTPQYEQPHQVGDTAAVGQALSQFGQDIDRAQAAKMTPEERELHNLKLKEAAASIALTGQQIAESKARIAKMTPAAPQGGVANAGDLMSPDSSQVEKVVPQVQTAISPGIGGSMQESQFVQHPDGGVSTIPNEKLAEIQESDPGAWFQGIGRFLGKQYDTLLSQFGNDDAYRRIMRYAPPVGPKMAKQGLVWRFNPRQGRFYPVKKGGTAYKYYYKHFGYGENASRYPVN